LLTAAAAVAAAVMLGGASPGAASRTTAGSCTPISSTQALSILALATSLQMRNTLDKVGGPLHSECNAVAWTGPTPQSQQAAFQLARSGHGAQFGIEAWRPNPTSPDVAKWKSNDYGALTHEFHTAAATFPGLFNGAGWPAKRIRLSSFGHSVSGFVVQVQGVGKGLDAAAGCWWNDKTYSAVCLLDEEAASKPVAKHLNQLAAIAVPKMLG
jgi:hypothetical protein